VQVLRPVNWPVGSDWCWGPWPKEIIENQIKYRIEYSPDTVDMETVSLSNNPKFIALIERSRARQKKEGGISIQEMRRRLGNPKIKN